MNDLDTLEVPPRRVLLVEDEAMSRSLLVGVLVSAGFEVESAESADEAARRYQEFDPDALVCDIDLGAGPTGLDLIVSLAAQDPHLPVVVLSNYVITPDYKHPVLSRAVYLRKRDLRETQVLLDALEVVLRALPEDGAHGADGTPLRSLTKSQVLVLRMIAEGLSNAGIAERRGCSVRAAEHMVQRTFIALGLGSDPNINTRVAAARIYIAEAGLPEHR